MRLGKLDLIATGKGVAKETVADDVTGMAAELSYRFFLAVFPFAIMLAALSGFVADAAGVQNPTEQIVDEFSATLPEDTASVLERQIEEVISSRDVGLLSIGLVGALWAAASGMGALIKALNRAYDVPETRPFWKKTLLAIGLTLTAGIAIVLAFVAMVGAGAWGKEIASWFNAGSEFETAVAILRWPIAVVLVMLAVAFLYWVAPNIDQKFHLVSPGAVVFTLVWIAATFAFGIYVSNFSSYNATYGALGGIAVLLLWFYISSAVLLIGAEINAIVDSQLDPDAVKDRREKVLAERMNAGPTPQEELEQRNHGADPLLPSTRPQASSGGAFAKPFFAVVGVVAAMFALRRLAR
jgi:membrane protein